MRGIGSPRHCVDESSPRPYVHSKYAPHTHACVPIKNIAQRFLGMVDFPRRHTVKAPVVWGDDHGLYCVIMARRKQIGITISVMRMLCAHCL
jgi:hypothetical protein